MSKSKKRGYQTSSTYDPKNYPGELNELASKTVPDQTMSLKTLVERFTRGQHVATLQPMYQFPDGNVQKEDLAFPDVEKLDKIERAELATDIATGIKQTQDALSNKKKARLKKEAKEAEAAAEEAQKATKAIKQQAKPPEG
ncbi:hypothetical protein [Microviridae sp.]|nr:hypothetical protein [Microviridae sp.]